MFYPSSIIPRFMFFSIKYVSCINTISTIVSLNQSYILFFYRLCLNLEHKHYLTLWIATKELFSPIFGIFAFIEKYIRISKSINRINFSKLIASNWPFAKLRTCGFTCDFSTLFFCDVATEKLLDRPFDFDVIMKTSAKRCDVGSLVIRRFKQ